jgi:hypothetical protein
MNIENKKPIFWGIGGGLSLLIFYFLILGLANSFFHAIEQLQDLWYWILILVLGFSIQVGLYVHIRIQFRQRKTKAAGKELAASAGVSTGSMVACCAHHLVDILPILGLSAIFLFLAEYQVFFILLGIVSNIIGIIFMLEIIKKHSFYKKTGALNQLAKFNIKEIKGRAIIGAILILLVSFFWIRNSNTQNSFTESEPLPIKLEVSDEASIMSLPIRSNVAGNLSVDIKPIDFSFDNPIQFEISLNTHQGDLDFDLTEKSILFDDKGNKYPPLKWFGGSGGHHISGELSFPPINKNAKEMRLIIRDVYGVKEREFIWSL